MGAVAATHLGDVLADVPILAGLREEMRAQLVEGATWLDLRAGEWLFRVGDPGDSLYLVASGRLEALATDDPPEVLREIGRGGIIGELALLTGSPRSASVRAKRDSRLFRVSRAEFELLLGDPDFSIALLRSLGSHLQASREVRSGSSPAPAVIAVVGADRMVPTLAIAEGIGERMSHHSSVVTLHPGSEGIARTDGSRAAYAEALDESERSNDCVLLGVDGAARDDDGWNAFAFDQADRVVVVTGSNDAALAPSVPKNSDQLLYGEANRIPPGAAPRATYRVPREGAGFGEALDRVTRRLSGRSVGIVLSGGGARGFAHIGALEALQEAGAQIDRIGGCSMGALVGALFAGGTSISEIRRICRQELVERNPMNDYTLPVSGLIRRHKGREMLRRMFGEQQIESLPLSYFCVSADLLGGELVVHGAGDLFRAVGASICLPGVSPPVPDAGRLLVDGGLLDNLPVETMAAMREGPVIAIDVSGRYQPRPRGARRPRAQRMEARLRRVVIGEEVRLPTLRETLVRTVVVGGIDTAEAARKHAELLIEPEVSGFGLTAFDRLEQIDAAGREAVEQSLAGGAPDWLFERSSSARSR